MRLENQQVRLVEMALPPFALLHSVRELHYVKITNRGQKWKFAPKVEL